MEVGNVSAERYGTPVSVGSLSRVIPPFSDREDVENDGGGEEDLEFRKKYGTESPSCLLD
jgi:hypothetical protein